MTPYMVGKLAPSSTHFTKGLVKYVPGRGYFRAVPSQNGDKFVTIPPPPIVERLVSHKKCPLVLFFYIIVKLSGTQSNNTKQSEVSLKQYSCTGSHNTICSKLAQLTLRKGRNYADSQAHSQAGPQTYRCLGWRNREVVFGNVEPKVETTSEDNFRSQLFLE